MSAYVLALVLVTQLLVGIGFFLRKNWRDQQEVRDLLRETEREDAEFEKTRLM